MHYGIAFTPLVPSLVLWLAAAAIVVIAGLLLLGRARGAAGRGAAPGPIPPGLAQPPFSPAGPEPLSTGAPGVVQQRPPQRFPPRRVLASSDRSRPSPTGWTIKASAATAQKSWCAATAK